VAFLFKKRIENPGEKLRELLKKEDILVTPGVFDPASALLVESLGFKSAYLSGAALTGSLAMPDLGLITFTELQDATRKITSVINIPLIVDSDTGFGESLNVYRTVKELEEAGAAAIQIEDQDMPKKCGHLSGKKTISSEDMVKKIVAANEARKDMLIVARTDSRATEGLESAIERANLYLEAGADIIFPEALTSLDEFKLVAKNVKGPLLANMTEFGKTPYISVEEFKEAGFKIVIFPVTTFRSAMKSIKDTLLEIKNKGTQKFILDKIMSREEFYNLIGYYEYEKRDNEFAKKGDEIIKGKK
jgi:methylisocitrate lyase